MGSVLSDEFVLGALRRLGNYRVEAAQNIAHEGPPDEISGVLLLALGMRESSLRNILNLAGTDRGCFQISDLYHADWLRSQPGCPSGLWYAEAGKTAVDPGHVPRYTPACVYACDLLKAYCQSASRSGVNKDMVLRFALAAYNAGVSGADRGLAEGDVDKFTTHGDYSAWTVAMRTQINHVLRTSLPHWIVS
jgi:hypothetical protein